MEIHTNRVTVVLDPADGEVHFKGPDGSHWSTVRIDTAVDLVAATDTLLGASGRESMGLAARAWQQRASARLDACLLLAAFVLIVEPLFFGIIVFILGCAK